MSVNSLPKWICQKAVHASIIRTIKAAGDEFLLNLACGASVAVSKEWAARWQPNAGGVFIRDSLGVESYESIESFKENYAKQEPGWIDKETKRRFHIVQTVDKAVYSPAHMGWYVYAYDGLPGLVRDRSMKEPRKGDRWLSYWEGGVEKHIFVRPSEFEKRFMREYDPNKT